MADSLSTLQLQSLTEAEMLNCSITPAGQWVQTYHIGLTRLPTFREKANLRATFYWLNIYCPTSQASLQKKVQGYLEATHHLIQIESWELVQQLLFLPLRIISSLPSSSIIPTPEAAPRAFYQQLRDLGFYREQIELYQTLLGKISDIVDGLCLDNLGYAYSCLCDYETAIGYYQRLLNLSSKLHSSTTEAKALGGLGRCNTFWGQYKIALSYCHQQLKLLDSLQVDSHNLPDTDLEEFIQLERGRTLTDLGHLAYYRRQYRKAVCYFQQSLAIVQPYHDNQTEWHALGGLALAYTQLRKYSQATATLEAQSQHTCLNAYQINASLLNLTTAYLYQCNFQAAIDCQQKLIDRSQDSGDIRSRCYALMYIAFIYFVQNKDSLAIEPLQQGLAIAQKFDYQQLKSQALAVFSCIYSRQRNHQKAMDYARESLAIARSLKDIPRFEAFAHIALGFAHFAKGYIISGLHALTTSLVLLPPWSSEDGKLMLIVIFKRLLTLITVQIHPRWGR